MEKLRTAQAAVHGDKSLLQMEKTSSGDGDGTGEKSLEHINFEDSFGSLWLRLSKCRDEKQESPRDFNDVS